MTTKLKPLMNRAVSDGHFVMPGDNWFQVAPLGDFPHESGVIQVIDEAAIRAMANAFVPGQEMLLDFDHESWSSDKPTRAAGWIGMLAAREDGLYGRIRWSASGLAAVEGGDYRWISPVWMASDCETLGNNRVRPLKLSDAGLTNRPNLKGIAALANRENKVVAVVEERPRVVRSADPIVTFDSIVRNHQARTKSSFLLSYDHCKATHPDEYRSVVNSALTFSRSHNGGLAVRNAQRDPHGEQLAPLSCPHEDAGRVFVTLVEQYQRDNETSFDKAWSVCQREHSFEWGNCLRLAEITDKNLHAELKATDVTGD